MIPIKARKCNEAAFGAMQGEFSFVHGEIDSLSAISNLRRAEIVVK
jgi:hypothetical protein